MRLKVVYCALLITLLSVCGVLSWTIVSSASSPVRDWQSVTDVTVDTQLETNVINEPWRHISGCHKEVVQVERLGALLDNQAVCSVYGTNAKLASYVSVRSPNVEYALKKSTDNSYHMLENYTGSFNPVLLSDDTLLGASALPTDHLGMSSLDMVHLHVADDFSRISESTTIKLYSLDTSQRQLIKDGTGDSVSVRRIAVSSNNKYAAVEVYGEGVGLVNLATLTLRYISTDKVGDYSDSGDKAIEMAVSNDGRYVAVINSKGDKYRIYFIDGKCGVDIFPANHLIDAPCDFIDFTATFNEKVANAQPYHVEFDDNSSQLSIHFVNTLDQTTSVSVIKPDPNSSERLTYLALGDSYSSGEGDPKDNYIDFEDKSANDCRINTLSYPFIVRDEFNIESSRMKSVACSGARVVFDYYRPMLGYLGHDSQLYNKSTKEINKIQKDSLDSFKPGQVPQLEFVKKYKPRVVTLTGGGNDVGFSDILTYCAWDNVEESVLQHVYWSLYDCAYAVKGSELQKMLVSTIQGQYAYNKRMIEEIQKDSPSTKIYTVGYPQFITTGDPCINKLMLSTNERSMINQSVTYLNTILKKVAIDTDTGYIDIEDSLTGGRICEGSKYVTGIADIGSNNSEQHNLFHPNPAGHRQIGARVANQLRPLFESDKPAYTADVGIIPTIFQGIESVMNAVRATLVPENIIKNTEININTESNGIVPGSKVEVNLYSDKTLLGDFTANSDGRLDFNISIPANIPVGFHILSIIGNDSRGQQVVLYQTVLVEGANPNDRNENGIDDKFDLCGFIASMDQAQDGQGCLLQTNSYGSQVSPARQSIQLANNETSTSFAQPSHLKSDTLQQFIALGPVLDSSESFHATKKVNLIWLGGLAIVLLCAISIIIYVKLVRR